ncbi:MAG: hypothetical protein P8Y53_15495 [Pseudolabrys sp.]
MTRIRIASLLALIVMSPVAAGAAYFVTHPHLAPCFAAGATAYRFAPSGKATVTVRIDNGVPHPDLRMQLVDDPAKADFVLVDGGGFDNACRSASAIESIRIDDHARKPSLTVALSRAPARYKIFVRSTRFSDRQAAALFAALWRKSGPAAVGNDTLARN